MSRPYSRRWLILVPLLGLGTLLQAQDKPQAPAGDSQTTLENAALQLLAERYFVAYAKKDLDGMMALWSPSSPDLAVLRKRAEQFFKSNRNITLTRIEFEKPVIAGEKAHFEVTFDLSAIETETGQPRAGLSKITRSLECLKQAGLWKIWHDSDAADDLAILLLAAKSEQERTTLLDRNARLVTPDLVETLVDEARAMQDRGEYERALSVHKIAYAIASTISDRRGMTRSLNNIGFLGMLTGKYVEAMQTLQRALAIAAGRPPKKDPGGEFLRYFRLQKLWDEQNTGSSQPTTWSSSISRTSATPVIGARDSIQVGETAWYRTTTSALRFKIWHHNAK